MILSYYLPLGLAGDGVEGLAFAHRLTLWF